MNIVSVLIGIMSVYFCLFYYLNFIITHQIELIDSLLQYQFLAFVVLFLSVTIKILNIFSFSCLVNSQYFVMIRDRGELLQVLLLALKEVINSIFLFSKHPIQRS